MYFVYQKISGNRGVKDMEFPGIYKKEHVEISWVKSNAIMMINKQQASAL